MYIMIQFINTIISFTSQNLPFSHRQNITQLTIFQPTLLSSSSEFLKFAGRSKKHPETQTHSAQCWNGCVFHSQPHWTWTLVPGWTTSQQCLSAGYIGESYIGWEEQLSRKRNWPCFKKCLYFYYMEKDELHSKKVWECFLQLLFVNCKPTLKETSKEIDLLLVKTNLSGPL